MQEVLIIDNYDSFTYNLAHYFEALDCKVSVVRNDKLSDVLIERFNKIVLSPGSGLPIDAGQLNSFITKYASSKSILGICLGQQAIAAIFGGTLTRLKQVNHGVSTRISHFDNDVLYNGIPTTLEVGLYHSWHTTDLPKSLIVTSKSKEGIIMSLKHSEFDLRAVQYHPESIMTPYGKTILQNWLKKD